MTNIKDVVCINTVERAKFGPRSSYNEGVETVASRRCRCKRSEYENTEGAVGPLYKVRSILALHLGWTMELLLVAPGSGVCALDTKRVGENVSIVSVSGDWCIWAHLLGPGVDFGCARGYARGYARCASADVTHW
jgi:hypothetical protein